MIHRQATIELFEEYLAPHPVRAVAAMQLLERSAGHQLRGAVFTRDEVVDFILDLSGYAQDRPLHKMRLLEPAWKVSSKVATAPASIANQVGVGKPAHFKKTESEISL